MAAGGGVEVEPVAVHHAHLREFVVALAEALQVMMVAERCGGLHCIVAFVTHWSLN